MGNVIAAAVLGVVAWYVSSTNKNKTEAQTGGLGNAGIPWTPELWPINNPTPAQKEPGEDIGWIEEFDIVTFKPRGIRNNNPGNIEYTGVKWQGLDNPKSDGRFMRFTSPEYGIRALARVLGTYYTRHGIDTVNGIINRWAPSFENDTRAYAEHVADAVGVEPDQRINVTNPAIREALVMAIIKHENGQQPYSLQTIREGVAMA